MALVVLKFLIVALTLVAFTPIVLSQDACYSPSGQLGQCLGLKECQITVDLQTQYGRFVPVSIAKQLKQMQCQHQKSDFHLCCPNDMVVGRRLNNNPFLPQQPTNRPQQTSSNQPAGNRIDQRGLNVLKAVTECGKKAVVKVSDGEDATLGEFPWLTLLKYDTDDSRPFLCGGSLITDRYVLTAAHCVRTSNRLIGVRLGEHNLDTDEDCQWIGRKRVCLPPTEEYGIEEIKAHEGYSRGSIENDIALIKLDRPVTEKTHIKPICLPIDDYSQDLAYDQSFYIAGWGRTDKLGAASILQKALVKRKELDVCRQFYNYASITDNHVCAVGTGIIHTCVGDSGGPLFFRHRFKETVRSVQYGVVSHGNRFCGKRQNQPGVFANVIDLLPWITQNIH